MKYKIGIQLFGRLRLNKFCLDYFEALKIWLGKKGYDIEYHGCFWDGEGLKEQLDNHPLVFKTLNFEQYPKSGYHTQQYVEDYSSIMNLSEPDKKSSCLFPSHYLLYKSYSYRKKYQYKYDVKYDFIICQRPDYLMGLKNLEYQLISFFEKNGLNSYTIYTDVQTPYDKKPQYPTCFGGDFLFGGDSRTMDLFCSSYNYFYNDNKKHYYKTHHLNYTQVIRSFNLWYSDSFRGIIIRTENPHEENDGAPLVPLSEVKLIESLQDDSTPSKND